MSLLILGLSDLAMLRKFCLLPLNKHRQTVRLSPVLRRYDKKLARDRVERLKGPFQKGQQQGKLHVTEARYLEMLLLY